MKMTRSQLTDAIELLLSCCISKLTDHFPDMYDISERQQMVFPATNLSDYERGIVQQTIWSIACLTAQTIDDGMGEGDTDTMLGMFSEQCAKFVAANWEAYGHPFNERRKKAWGNDRENVNRARMKDYCLHHPDARKLAEDFVNTLCCLEMGGVEFPHSIVDEPQKA